MIDRRHLLKSIGCAGAGILFSKRAFAIPPAAEESGGIIRFGIISDLHHLQFKQDEVARLRGFMDAAITAAPHFIVQCGDLCPPQQSEPLLAEWNRFPGPKYHVLGNHDMDHGSKEAFMKIWGMENRYYSFDLGGYHFVTLDRNCLKKDDGTITDYDRGNWYRTSASQKSFSDQPQLEWLRKDLAQAKGPVIVFMHQPVFLSEGMEEMGNWRDILAIFDESNYQAEKEGRAGKVASVFMGHDHDDRYGIRNGVHYFMLNSATYAYTEHGADFYRDPLYAFVTLDPKGKLSLEGRSSSYKDSAPDSVKAVIPPRISSYAVSLGS